MNPLGFLCYSIFNISLYASPTVRSDYRARHDGHAPQVQPNDIAFAVHACAVSSLTLVQSCVYKRDPSQHLSTYNRMILLLLCLSLTVLTVFATVHHLSWLTLIVYLSSIKLYVSAAKMVPQAWLNYRRKSTVGWSIENILLDATGGLLSFFGTRLRPLTLTYPKPLVPFANKAIILHLVENLVKAGVKHIVLAVNYRPEVMISVLKQYEEKYNINITFSVENEPLGTAGPLALAREVLGKDDAPFFVLNSDVTCSYPFEELRDFHLAHGGEGTIMVTKVDEPSKYGVVLTVPGQSTIDRFVEKPKEYVGNRINAGIYIFNPSILDRIEVKPTSIESEIFPAMARDRQLHSMDLEGFWMDIGQPKDYLTGTCLYLSYLTSKKSPELADPAKHDAVVAGNVLIHPTATVDPTAVIGPNVVVGPNCTVAAGARLQRCVLLDGSKVCAHAFVRSTIVGWSSRVGKHARLDEICVLGDDVNVKDEICLLSASVLPHKSVSSSIYEPSIVM
ncbi:mannose-1-phosphate guanylyltransferase [Rhodotorula toruloides]|uniref:mannose-1-phosphate guanylyltransferase n=1 Tax=Rhodotorula toruloides TaxID=5286 RepID=A0A511KHU6_RHOTO|nr:mannose-1-phosphate guanylyltransferase [Rhodotorula toruloides]